MRIRPKYSVIVAFS